MAGQNCWRCLSGPSQLLRAPSSSLVRPVAPISALAATTPAAGFSTTPAHGAATGKSAGKKNNAKDLGMGKHHRAGKRLVLTKNRPKFVGKPVGPGERKAARKRIQLSNDNALPVPGLRSISEPQDLADPRHVGQVLGLPPALIDQLRTAGAFKTTQNWGLFRSPHTLVRAETADLCRRMLDDVSKNQTCRVVVTGSRGSGKSLLGLQALSTAYLNKWVVINIPEGQDLVNGHTDYTTVPNSDLFSHSAYTLKLLQDIHKTSGHILSQHKVKGDYINLPVSINRGMNLSQLCTITKDPELAWTVFKVFFEELILPGRPPIMFAVDGLNHIMRHTKYRSPAYELIHSHDFGLLRLFAEALGGKTKFANGAAILGVTTKSNCPLLPSVDKALEQATAAQAGQPIPEREPYYRKYDERVFDALKNVTVMDVQGISKNDARALMEYWAASGILRQKVDEYAVSDGWSMSGGGILAEMEKTAFFDARVSTQFA